MNDGVFAVESRSRPDRAPSRDRYVDVCEDLDDAIERSLAAKRDAGRFDRLAGNAEIFPGGRGIGPTS
jgi:hypothetical protein